MRNKNVVWATLLGFVLLMVGVLSTVARAGSGTFTITSVTDNMDSTYTLDVSSTTGMQVGDHFGAPLAAGGDGLYTVDSITDGDTLVIGDDIDEENGGVDYGVPTTGPGWYSTPSSEGYSLPPYNARNWSPAVRRNAYLLGTMATQDANAVAITGGSVTGITDVTVADGGTGASTAGDARTNLGLVIGTDVQAQDAGLADIAGLAVTDGNIIVGDDANWVAESGATARTSLGLGSIATQAASSVAITGGTIDGTAIGGTTPAAAEFTQTLVGSNVTGSYGDGDLVAGSDNTDEHKLEWDMSAGYLDFEESGVTTWLRIYADSGGYVDLPKGDSIRWTSSNGDATAAKVIELRSDGDSTPGYFLMAAEDTNDDPTALLHGVMVASPASDPETLTNADNGKIFTNEGATAEQDYTLPSISRATASGDGIATFKITFICQDSDGMKITAASGDTIRMGAAVSASAGYISTTTVGNTVTLIAINATEWIAVEAMGSGPWTVN